MLEYANLETLKSLEICILLVLDLQFDSQALS